jgi:NADH dehydrogenase
LYAAKALRRAPVRVTLIDRRNHHLFQPLLYQVATAGLSGIDIGAPIRLILRRQKNTTVLLADVRRVDVEAKRVVLTSGDPVPYDYLIVSTGVTHSYFGNESWAHHAPGLKSLDDALTIRRKVLLAFEEAERARDAEARRAWLTFVVVGGGPTGAELAGALSEIARHTLVGEFRNFDPSEARILLLEGGPRILPSYPPELSGKAKRQLDRLGVEVRTEALVTGIDAEGVQIGNERVVARTVLWAAGVVASPIGRSLGAPVDRVGRVLVNPDLSVAEHGEVFVVGDLAYLEVEGTPVPGLAPAAVQQGEQAAKNILRSVEGRTTLPFRYRDRGSMATLGRKAAIAVIGGIQLSGLVAWLAWLFVHIFFLIGFRNRIVVMFEWSKSYLTFQRSARLILEERSDPSEGIASPKVTRHKPS